MMFGYACNETEELMPLPISLAHKLVRKLAEVRKTDELDYLRPDGKSQVTVEYDGGKPVRLDAVVISTQHSDRIEQDQLKAEVIDHVMSGRWCQGEMVDANTKYHINPTGRFVVGGPHGDTGLTGRKIIVDTYGGMGRHGGGAFSGKDPDQGRPLGHLHGAACRQKHRCRRTWRRTAKSNWPTPSVSPTPSR